VHRDVSQQYGRDAVPDIVGRKLLEENLMHDDLVVHTATSAMPGGVISTSLRHWC
jgi:hypothetical protein